MTTTEWDLEPPEYLCDDSPDPDAPARRTSWTAAELMAEKFPEPRWAVPGVIPQGLTLLAGAPKLGKSWLAMNLGVAIASGGMALGSIRVDEGDVLYLALEDNGRRLQSRLRMVLQGDTAPARLTLATECPTLHDGGRERITGWLDAHPDARLVVVDVFARMRGTTARGADKYEADYRSVADLKAIADLYDVAMILVHHTRKTEADDYLDSVSGSQGLAGAADGVAILARSRGAAAAVLKITGRDVTEADHALDFDAPTGTWKILAGPASDYEMGDTRRRIAQLLRDADPMTPHEVAVTLSITDDNARQTLTRMVKADTLDTDGQGHYFTPSTPVTPVTPVTQPPIGRDSRDSCDSPTGEAER
jgi:hypothetical protein